MKTFSILARKPFLTPVMRLLWTVLLVLPASGAQAGVVFTSLHSFHVFPYGANPTALVQGGNGNFYGITSDGGTNRGGTVFEVTTNGALTTLYSFAGGTDGETPTGLAQGRDGDFYGTTYYGGTNNDGTVFRITADGVLTTLCSFAGSPEGELPLAGVAQGRDGDFYGTTYYGGTNNDGTVFKISGDGSLTTLYSFGVIRDVFGHGHTLDGANPQAMLTEGSDGNFYGTTYYGGTNNDGTVFKITTNGALTTLYSFGAVTNADGEPLDGAYPGAGLVQGSDGSFYGATYGGGTENNGTVYKINTNGALTTLYSFGAVTNADGEPLDGGNPDAGLTQGGEGSLYGTTEFGGTNGAGTVFEITTNGTLIRSYSLTGGNGGVGPEAGMVQGSNGNFYSTTAFGGTNGDGTVFNINGNWVLTTLYSFPGATDGESPLAGLVQGSDGNFYGTTYGYYFVSDSPPYGTIFKMSANGALTSIHTFGAVQSPFGAVDGANPRAGLVQGSDGYFYGTTEDGGTNGDGTVFKMSTNGALTTLYSFSMYIGPETLNGQNPSAGLVQGSDGYLYGTTENGGFDDFGTVFKISANGTATNLYSFDYGVDGAHPKAGLIQGSDGELYGTAVNGGDDANGLLGYGCVFKISTNGTLTTLYEFGTITNALGEPLDGAGPQAGLALGSDGNFYGTTSGGGTYNNGTVFKITSDGALTTVYSFSGGTNGESPQAEVVQGGDGGFYGTTVYGGAYDAGTVFRVTTNGALTTLYSFTGGNDGGYPFAGLVQGSNGNFYGTTFSGGLGGLGTVFRLTVEPEFQAATLSNGTLSLTWSTEAGGTYQLQYNSDLNSTNWTSLASAVTASGAMLSKTDIVTNAPQRFYRLVLLP